MILHAYVDVYVLCVCIVNHGHGYCVTIQHYDCLYIYILRSILYESLISNSYYIFG